MAGAKISKLPIYEDVFEGEFLDDMEEMLIPLSLKQFTIRVPVKYLIENINKYNGQNYIELTERFNELSARSEEVHQQIVATQAEIDEVQNQQLESEVTKLTNKINNLKTESDQIHQQMKDTQAEINEVQTQNLNALNTKIDTLKDLSDQIHQQMKDAQAEIDEVQNQNLNTEVNNLVNKINDLKTLSEQIHQQMINTQQQIDTIQNQEIENIKTAELWEIYNGE